MPFVVTGGHWEDQGYWETYSTLAWDAGARTIATLENDGVFTFSVGQATGIICGLNSVDESADYLEIEHAFFIQTGQAKVVENGEYKTEFSTYSTLTSAFKIERIGGVVKYYIDDVLKYTSSLPSTGTVFLDCSLFAANDTIIFGDTYAIETNPNEELEITLPKLSVGFQESTSFEYIALTLSPLTVYLEEYLVFELHITLPKLTLTFVMDDVNILNITLPKLTLFLRENQIIPDFATLQFSLTPLRLYLLEDENLSLELTLHELQTLATDLDSFCAITLPNLLIGFQESIQDFGFMECPNWTMTAHVWINEALLTIPAPLISIAGTVHTSRIEFSIPAPTISAYGGGITTFTIPAPTLAIAGTTQQLARVEFEIPAPELAMTALVGATGRVAFTLPAPTLKAYSGGRVSFTLPAPVVTVAGTTEILARVALHIPSPVVAMAGEVYGLARVAFEIPAPILAVGRGNWVEFEIPAPLVAVSATYVGTTTQAAEEVTYAVNLNTGAVTQLLLGGFDKLVTAHGRLYGLKDGALTRLEGDVDGTETLIPATIRFAANTFDTNNVKRISNVYWSTRESDGITMDLIADERTVWRYQTTTDTAPAFGTHKIKTGLGVVFHTAGIVLRNRDGGTLDIGGGEFIVHPLSRKPR